ncbi:MAG TPA: porin family protein [Flavobacterium lutivivi]|nr:porin family protein [Flavobacterium lutivivi]
MKKIICLGLLFSSFLMNSQSREKGAIEIVPLIGYSSSNYYGESNLDNSTLSSVNFGVEGDYYFNDRWSLRSGLLFQTMGTKFSGYKEELKYITIPVNANWHFGSTRKWNLNFGLNAGFLTSADANGTDIKDLANSFQLGIAYGIGYKLEVSPKFSLLFDMQGMTGMTEVAKDSDYTLKNAYSTINIGGVFKL